MLTYWLSVTNSAGSQGRLVPFCFIELFLPRTPFHCKRGLLTKIWHEVRSCPLIEPHILKVAVPIIFYSNTCSLENSSIKLPTYLMLIVGRNVANQVFFGLFVFILKSTSVAQ